MTTLTENRRPAVIHHSDLQSELVKQPKLTNLVLRLKWGKLILMSISGVLRYKLININFPFQHWKYRTFLINLFRITLVDLASGSIKSSEGWTRQIIEFFILIVGSYELKIST